jgi:hypothetical protein
MKRVLLSVVLMAGFAAFADHPDHIQSKGHAVYKVGSKVEKKEAELYVPKTGKGKLFLAFDGKEVESDRTWMTYHNGRHIFYVQFSNLPGAPKDMTVLLRGSLIKGDNLGVYYGDFFVRTTKAAKVADMEIDEKTATCLAEGSCGEEVASADTSDDQEWGGCKGGCKGGSCGGGCKGHHHGGRHHGRHHGRHGHGHAHGWTYGGGFGFSAAMTK